MNVPINTEFTKFVEMRRKSKGLGLRELARRAEMDPSLLNKYLKGEKSAGPEQMERILAALGFTAHLKFVAVQENLVGSA